MIRYHSPIVSSSLPWENQMIVYHPPILTFFFTSFLPCIVKQNNARLHNKCKYYRVSHSKVCKVILLWWGYRFAMRYPVLENFCHGDGNFGKEFCSSSLACSSWHLLLWHLRFSKTLYQNCPHGKIRHLCYVILVILRWTKSNVIETLL